MVSGSTTSGDGPPTTDHAPLTTDNGPTYKGGVWSCDRGRRPATIRDLLKGK